MLTSNEIISRLDRIIALLEAIHAQGQPKPQTVNIMERGMPSHHLFVEQKPIEALSPDYKRQMEINPAIPVAYRNHLPIEIKP